MLLTDVVVINIANELHQTDDICLLAMHMLKIMLIVYQLVQSQKLLSSIFFSKFLVYSKKIKYKTPKYQKKNTTKKTLTKDILKEN